jgi:hypothetical protein
MVGVIVISTIHDISMNPKAHPAAAHGDRDPAALWAQERNACEAKGIHGMISMSTLDE